MALVLAVHVSFRGQTTAVRLVSRTKNSTLSAGNKELAPSSLACLQTEAPDGCFGIAEEPGSRFASSAANSFFSSCRFFPSPTLPLSRSSPSSCTRSGSRGSHSFLQARSGAIMNKSSLLTLGKRLNDGNLYFLSVHDLEPSGIIIHAYDQVHSKEYILPVSEQQVKRSAVYLCACGHFCFGSHLSSWRPEQTSLSFSFPFVRITLS